MTEFKVGDRVRFNNENSQRDGEVGTVSESERSQFYDYMIRFEDGADLPVHSHEISHIEPKIEIGKTYIHNGKNVPEWYGRNFTVTGVGGNVYDWIGKLEGVGVIAANSDQLEPTLEEEITEGDLEQGIVEGDLVEASKGEDLIKGRARLHDDRNGPVVHGKNIRGLIRVGWQVEVIEKAKIEPKLPTEDGFYQAKNKSYGFLTYQLNYGNWTQVTARAVHTLGEDEVRGLAGELVPLVRKESD